MSEFQYKWQEHFEAALLEEDPEKLKLRIARAELEMFRRYQELGRTSNHNEERAKLDDATMKLHFLQAQKFGYSQAPGTGRKASD